MIEYTKSVVRGVAEDEILDMKLNEKNKECYLVGDSKGNREWYVKAEDGFIKDGVKIPARWKHATSHVFRKRRTITLTLDYVFDPIDLAWYGGWTEHSQASNLPVAVKHYLHMDLVGTQEARTILKRMAGRYFSKLLQKHGGL